MYFNVDLINYFMYSLMVYSSCSQLKSHNLFYQWNYWMVWNCDFNDTKKEVKVGIL